MKYQMPAPTKPKIVIDSPQVGPDLTMVTLWCMNGGDKAHNIFTPIELREVARKLIEAADERDGYNQSSRDGAGGGGSPGRCP